MLYFNNDEERLVRVERIFEDLHRKPAPLKSVARVLVAAEPPGSRPMPAPPTAKVQH